MQSLCVVPSNKEDWLQLGNKVKKCFQVEKVKGLTTSKMELYNLFFAIEPLLAITYCNGISTDRKTDQNKPCQNQNNVTQLGGSLISNLNNLFKKNRVF